MTGRRFFKVDSGITVNAAANASQGNPSVQRIEFDLAMHVRDGNAAVAGSQLVNHLSAGTKSQEQQKTENEGANGQGKSPAWNL